MTGQPVPVTLRVNGRREVGRAEPRVTLAEFLREELGLTGTHVGCEQGVCGACTVVVDGVAVRSCLMFAVQCDGNDRTARPMRFIRLPELSAPSTRRPLR